MKTIAQLKKENILPADSIINMGVPPIYESADIDKCPKDIKKWIQGDRNKKGLYMWGPVGTGKTYSAYAMYKMIRANRIPVKISNSTSLLNEIRDDFTYSSRDQFYRRKFDAWMDHEGVMIIDDIGSEKPTEWALQTFYSLINKRYEQNLPTIFTSNYSIEEIADRLGDRIASRIVEMCEIKKIDGEDRRLTNQK